MNIRNSALAGLQAALVLMLSLPLIYLSPWPEMIGFAALGSLCALFGRFAPSHERANILAQCGLLQISAVLFMSLVGWAGFSDTMKLAALAAACGIFYWIALTRNFGPPGPLIFIFAAGAAMQSPVSFTEVMERGVATAAIAMLAWILCRVTENFRRSSQNDLPQIITPNRATIKRAAMRVTVASAISIFLAYELGAAHPMWAAMATIAVLQAPRLDHSIHRLIQRTAGTIIGTLGIWLFLNMEPNIWIIFAVLALLQIATEIVIGANYGLGQIFVTPMALLMTFIASRATNANPLLVERILDTLLGVIIGLAIALLWSTVDERSIFGAARTESQK